MIQSVMSVESGRISVNGFELNWVRVSPDEKSTRVLLLLDVDENTKAIENMDITRKFEQVDASFLVIQAVSVVPVETYVGKVGEFLPGVLSKLEFVSPVLVGKGTSAAGIIHSVESRAVKGSGIIALSPAPDERVFSLLYRIDIPAWFVYGRKSTHSEERTMFRYHDLTAGSRLLKIRGEVTSLYTERPSQFISLLADYLDHAGI